MLRYFILCFCALAFTACKSNSPEEFTRYYEDGRAKPVIAIAPMIDTTSNEFSWSLADEMQSLIMNRIAQKGTLFVNRDENAFIPSSENPFGTDVSWVKREFAPNEFVVFLELVEHESVPTSKTISATDSSSNLNMQIRVRIIDIRSNSPKIVLQEVIRDSYYITKNTLPTDYNMVTWGTDEYMITPMSQAHSKITKEVVERLNDYVLLAKSRWNG